MTFQWIRWALLAVTISAAACTKEQNACKADSDCTNPAYPFCDVNGEFSASGGAKNVCTIVPDDCPVERCGCSPGATTCADGTLSTCDPGGTSKTTTTCVLGCASDGTRCLSFVPSNGLGPALVASAEEPDIDLPSGSHINTDTGTVTDGASIPIQVSSLVVTQGASTIRVFIGHSMVIGDVAVTGTSALAIVASDTIELTGNLRANGAFTSAAPGAQETGICVGGVGQLGGGGGGNATMGGNGGKSLATSIPAPGGAAVTSFEPLVGGCRGGNQTDTSGNTIAIGGGGGGAIQLVAGTSIEIAGTINVGAGGGASAAGGGSGGLIILQSPHVTLTGGLYANGGGGGACDSSGADATADLTPASGAGPCGNLALRGHGGSGGTGTAQCGPANESPIAGGGGGAVGRVQVMTEGTFDPSTGTVSAALTTAQLQPI
jgi:hypothetical protein